MTTKAPQDRLRPTEAVQKLRPAGVSSPFAPRLVFSTAWLAVCLLAVIFADLLPLADPNADAGVGTRVSPFDNWRVPLGTDTYGRDVLARLIYGGRASLAIGVGAATVSAAIGGAIGLAAGYSRHYFDGAVRVVTDAVLTAPALLVLMALAATLGPSFGTLSLGLVIVSLPHFVRLSRANTLRFVEREFVQAARASGARPRRILFRELLPNIVRPVGAYVVTMLALLIIAESSLSFLGLGLRPPTSSWGVMINEGRAFLQTYPYMVLVPGCALFCTVFSLNTWGDYLGAKTEL